MLKSIRNLFRRTSPKSEERSFKAAAGSRLTMDWIIAPLSADAAMRGRLGPMRDRARDLERNNEWVRGFLRVLENNVCGRHGIQLQMRVRDPGTGRMDELANDQIEMAFWRGTRVGALTACGRHSWRDLCRLMIRTMARDGEVIIRKKYTREGLRLQIIEADLLDEQSWTEPNGNAVRMGVEIDADRRPVAYHLLGYHPGDLEFQQPTTKRIRVPAEEIYHLYITERPDQTRGFPWLVASMNGLKMLDGYSEAELVAARTGAAKMGFFTKQTPDGWTGDVDGDGNLSMDASPGTIEELPAGVNFQSWDSDHPNSGFGDFVKARLRAVATSLGVSYNTLASDLEGVNYSSIRAGLLEEREVWIALQEYLIEHFCEPFFTAWLEVELLSGRLALPYAKMWKFNAPEFRGRRWAWVDPKKDMEAIVMARRAGMKSIRQAITESGGDVFETFRDIQADDELAESLGIKLPAIDDEPAATVQAEIDNDQ